MSGERRHARVPFTASVDLAPFNQSRRGFFLPQHPHDLGCRPFLAPGSLDVSLIQGSRYLPKGCSAARLKVGNDWPDVGSPPLGLGGSDDGTGQRSLLGHEVDLAPVAAELNGLAPGTEFRLLLVREPRIESPLTGQGILGPSGNHLSLMLRYRRQDMDGKAVGLGEVHGGELDAGLHEVEDEGHIAGQAIQLRDDEDSAMEAAQAQGLSQARAVIILAALDFHHLCHELPVPAVEVRADGFLLRLEAKPGSPLLFGRDTVIGNELARLHRKSPEAASPIWSKTQLHDTRREELQKAPRP
jgi:hypothetical protein